MKCSGSLPALGPPQLHSTALMLCTSECFCSQAVLNSGTSGTGEYCPAIAKHSMVHSTTSCTACCTGRAVCTAQHVAQHSTACCTAQCIAQHSTLHSTLHSTACCTAQRVAQQDGFCQQQLCLQLACASVSELHGLHHKHGQQSIDDLSVNHVLVSVKLFSCAGMLLQSQRGSCLALSQQPCSNSPQGGCISS